MPPPLFRIDAMTITIAARCSRSGMFGVAITSSSPAVGARCPYVRAGVGAVSTQNVTDPELGPKLLDRLTEGLTARAAIAAVTKGAPHIAYRQLLCVDKDGDSAVYSGAQVLGVWAEAHGPDAAAAGNLLANTAVPQAMLDAFLASTGHLGDRLVGALRAGLVAGGEAGPVRSASLKLADRLSWPVAEIRCDWTEDCPVEAVAQGWAVYKPQMAAYVQRALDPSVAPSFGVPGDG
jgi:uncharacterized Ntn-hydrolase superfamily protein